MKQFEQVCSKFGAPMGRTEYGPTPDQSRTIRLFKVDMNGPYDTGGAYWGLGEPIYCAQSLDGEYRRFVRATSRLTAVVELDLEREMLVSPPMMGYRRLYNLEQKGNLGASGIILRQKLQQLGYT